VCSAVQVEGDFESLSAVDYDVVAQHPLCCSESFHMLRCEKCRQLALQSVSQHNITPDSTVKPHACGAWPLGLNNAICEYELGMCTAVCDLRVCTTAALCRQFTQSLVGRTLLCTVLTLS
jgi:hypothetical protein